MQDFSGFSIDLTAGSPARSPRFEEYLANGLAVSFFTSTIPRTRSSSFLLRRSQTRGRKIVDAIVTSSGQWGESIPSCSALVHPPTPNHDSRPSAFRVSPFVHAACYFFPALSEHVSTSGQCPTRSFFDDGNNDGEWRRRSIVAVVIPSRIRYVDVISRKGKERMSEKV